LSRRANWTLPDARCGSCCSGIPADLKGDAKAAFEEMALAPAARAGRELLSGQKRFLDRAPIPRICFIDAIVGTGFKPPLHGS
jgi:hypothetical protein